MTKQSALGNIKKYVVYYGHNNEDLLLDYELLILEPNGHSNEALLRLKSAKKIVVAYLSVIEIRKEDEIFKLLTEEDLISINGKLVVNPEYKTYYMDITKVKVREILKHRAISFLKNGYDGIFLDTIGNLDYLNVPYLYKEELYRSASLLLSEIKSEFPKCIFIQNNGFVGLCDYTINYLDAICFENPPMSSMKNLLWTYSVIKRLNHIKNDNNLKVLLLEEKLYNKSSPVFYVAFIIRKILIKNGWLHYKGLKYYNQL